MLRNLAVRRLSSYKLESLLSRLDGKQYVNGKLIAPLSGKYYDAINPSTNKKIALVPASGQTDIDHAVAAAVKAQKDWKALPVRQRGAILAKCGHKISENIEEFAQLCSLETGKAIRTESRVEAGILADVFHFFGGLGGEMKGETIPWNPNSLTYTQYEPYGVVGAIVPWNVPMMLMALKVAPALLMGNTVVVKPAEPAAIILTRLTELLGEVLPPGVLNTVTGLGSVTGNALTAHPDIKKITFTGSVDTGRIVYKAAAEKIIPCTLELGGKSPMIVCSDADVNKSVDGAFGGMRFTRAGQSCTASTRIFVHESIYNEFRDKLVAKVNNLKMGNPNSEETDMGTVITKVQMDKIKKFIEIGTKDGKANVCSKLPEDPTLKDGFWIRPVIFEQLSNDHHLSRNEIFGPVTCLVKYADLEDAIAQANDSKFGLAASIWTTNLKNALRGVNALQAGCVQVNQNVVINPNFPCGGWKQSGLGREASLEDMLESFAHKKTISMNML